MSDKKLAHVQKKSRRRVIFTLLVLALYFSFSLNWFGFGDGLRATMGETPITGSLLMFITLIVGFIALEFLFLAISDKDDH